MKKLPLLILTLMTGSVIMAQTGYKKLPSLGVHFFYNDFATAAEIRNSSLNTVLEDDQWHNTGRMNPGLAVSYFQGLSNHVDIAATLSGSFLRYPIPEKAPELSDHLLLELAFTANLKLLTDKHCINPYITAGVGASKYRGYYSAIMPLGLGLQIKIVPEVFLHINSQYRLPITENAAHHFYHSFGIIAPVKSRPEPVVVAVAPPPPVILDRDGDGINDTDDKCPDVAGIIALQGCPDKDGDGIADLDDACPDVAGLAKYKGCPIPDTDGDGINDELDQCVSQKGVARYQGCPIPDKDGDGVNDEEDKCPNVVGPLDNFGCPVIGIKSYEIDFKSGSSILLPKGKQTLDSVANYLKRHDAVAVTIDGHTDNTGTDKVNDPLSVKRAEASKAYLVSKGVDASRMTTAGYGSKQPIEDNKTPEGRRKNRRIEIKIKG